MIVVIMIIIIIIIIIRSPRLCSDVINYSNKYRKVNKLIHGRKSEFKWAEIKLMFARLEGVYR